MSITKLGDVKKVREIDEELEMLEAAFSVAGNHDMANAIGYGDKIIPFLINNLKLSTAQGTLYYSIQALGYLGAVDALPEIEKHKSTFPEVCSKATRQIKLIAKKKAIEGA